MVVALFVIVVFVVALIVVALLWLSFAVALHGLSIQVVIASCRCVALIVVRLSFHPIVHCTLQ